MEKEGQRAQCDKWKSMKQQFNLNKNKIKTCSRRSKSNGCSICLRHKMVLTRRHRTNAIVHSTFAKMAMASGARCNADGFSTTITSSEYNHTIILRIYWTDLIIEFIQRVTLSWLQIDRTLGSLEKRIGVVCHLRSIATNDSCYSNQNERQQRIRLHFLAFVFFDFPLIEIALWTRRNSNSRLIGWFLKQRLLYFHYSSWNGQ